MALPPLARSLAPLPEESLPGYLLRVAHRLGRSPGRIAALCGLSSYERRLPAHYLITVPDDVATVFASAARLSRAEVDALTLRGYAGACPALTKIGARSAANTATQQDIWAFNHGSRYCPKCLTGDGSPIQATLGGPWKLRWHLPVVFACTVRRRLLEYTCPACGNGLGGSLGNRGNLIRQPLFDDLHPLQCRNPQRDSRPSGPRSGRKGACGARLDEVPKPGSALCLEDPDRLVALQERLDHQLAPVAAESADSQPGGLFPDLILAGQLIKLSWPVGADLAPSDAIAALVDSHAAPIAAILDGPQATAPGRYLRIPDRSAPDDPAQRGALLLAADALLGDREPAALRERVQPLVQAACERAPTRAYQALRNADVSAFMARALVRRRQVFHAGGSSRGPGHLRIPSRNCRFSTEEVPPLLPQAWFAAHFPGITDRMTCTTAWTMRHLRRAASLKLVEMTAGGTWAESAEMLGIPRGSAERTLFVLNRQMPTSDLWEEFEASVERIAAELDNNPRRVNYARRRRAMATWQMPLRDWTDVCSGIAKLGRLAARQDPALATVLVWTEVTQAEHLNCPLLSTPSLTRQDRTRLLDNVAQFLTPAHQKGGRLELRRRLDAYAARLAARCDVPTPPTGPGS
ncbi:hypothetical protein AV521_04760 [Streptomyces sp. IMTB 2501]|uniref:TniQ family protein n=1 Tax=Streptomyces sp. IMTB 2501 TaxID=1776340 RepID=UPI00096D5899|nr:TniQ family protein [Streptomyces sp. IMTB 2501]OLZ73393.1 hypothetical protein AV521_04760 [Streptomyces sp. IMTB 2501]